MLVASVVRSRRMKRRWKALEKLGFSALAIFGIPPLLHSEKFCQHYRCRTGRETFRAQKTSSACRSGPRSAESTNRVACLFHDFVRDLFGSQRVLRFFPRLHPAQFGNIPCGLGLSRPNLHRSPAGRRFRVRARNGAIPAALESSREAGPFKNTCITCASSGETSLIDSVLGGPC